MSFERDPLFQLFDLPGAALTQTYFHRYLVREGKTIAFKSPALQLGFYPAWYRPNETTESPHTHRFLELSMVVTGEGEQRLVASRIPLRSGDLIFSRNRELHSFKSRSADFSILVFSFLPSAFDLSDALLDSPLRLGQHALFLPFVTGVSAQSEGLFRPETDEFRKLVFHGFRILEIFVRKEDPENEILGGMFRNFLALVVRGFSPVKQTSLAEVLAYVEEHFREPLSLQTLARHADLNPSYFSTLFNRHTGLRLSTYLNRRRLKEGARLLRESTLSVSQIASEIGFVNAGHFSQAFRQAEGLSPLAYRAAKRLS